MSVRNTNPLLTRAPKAVNSEVPRSLEDLHLPRDLVASLVLRTLAAAGQLSGASLEARLGLPFEVIQPVIDEFQRSQLLDTVGFAAEHGLDSKPIPVRMAYVASSAGRQRAAELAAVQTRYLGPCPINFDDYVELIKGQVGEKTRITDEMLRNALRNLELEKHVYDQVGGAMISRASLFLFGAPGNGKSTITERMALLMGDPIQLPHAVAVGEEVIRVIDPIYHVQAEGEQPADKRLLRVNRPLVAAGGELKLDQLELTYDPQSRYYEAPLQWKANGGLLVIDDFGRQQVPANRLLNRFIVPMEKKIDHLDLSATGRKIDLPFLCQVVFATNISPTDLLDEAFLRRLAYKIGVGNPSPEAYARILKFECERNNVPFDERAVPYLLKLYDKRPLRGSHPKQLIARLIDLASYRQQPPRLTPQSLKEAYDACFNPALGSVSEEDWAKPNLG